jgi:hypothetical protein
MATEQWSQLEEGRFYLRNIGRRKIENYAKHLRPGLSGKSFTNFVHRIKAAMVVAQHEVNQAKRLAVR